MKALDESFVETLFQNVVNKPTKEELSIRHLDDELKDGTLVIDEDYQRGYLYDNQPKVPSKLIESAFLGLVIPEIQCFYDTTKGTKELIDGQQRVLSLVRFYRGEYALSGLELLPQLNGMRFEDLPIELQRVFKNYSLKACLISGDSEAKFEAFARLNTGSKALNAQEIRNAIYRGPVMNLAKELANHKDVERLLYGVKNQRFARVEGVLRLLSLMHYEGVQMKSSTTQNINNFLESTTQGAIDASTLNRYKEEFLKTCRHLNQAFDLPVLFNRPSKVLYVHLDALFLAAWHVKNPLFLIQNSEELTELLSALIHQNPIYGSLSLYNEHQPIKLKQRLGMIEELFRLVQENGTTPQLDARRAFSVKEKKFLWTQEVTNHNQVKCAICHQSIHQPMDAEVDHIYPWSKGGKTTLTNAQLTHVWCNRNKQDKVNDEDITA